MTITFTHVAFFFCYYEMPRVCISRFDFDFDYEKSLMLDQAFDFLCDMNCAMKMVLNVNEIGLKMIVEMILKWFDLWKWFDIGVSLFLFFWKMIEFTR